MAEVTVLIAGLYTSIQDGGRVGYRKYGVPVSGSMDQYNGSLANIIVNNPAGHAVMEITLTGPTLSFEAPAIIAITGADISPRLGSVPLAMNRPVAIQAGDIVSFGRLLYGARAYLALKGGFASEMILGSQSYCHCITPRTRLQVNQRIAYTAAEDTHIDHHAHVKPVKAHFKVSKIVVSKGPEFELLSDEQQKDILKEKFIVSSHHNRMGYKLEGPSITLKEADAMITSAVIPGTVQVTPSGHLIMLMRDCQTTGGYPRVLQLKEMAISQMAQKKTGDWFKFVVE